MWRRELTLVLAFALLLSSFQVHADARSYDASKIDPALLEEVLADPKADYDVIVRSVPSDGKGRARDDRAKRAGDEIGKAGGTARHALGIVGGASGRIKGQLLLALTNQPGIDYVYADAPVQVTFDPTLDASKAQAPGPLTVNAPSAWTQYGVTGKGIGVAVVDSGVAAHADLAGRIKVAIDFTGETQSTPTASTTPLGDPGGHGTHVAGIIAGDGTSSGGHYTGIAPNASIIDVRVIRSDGTSNTSIVLRGLQWVLAKRTTYNIRVVNMSLGAEPSTSYKLDPLATAAEVLNFARVVVVVSAGNKGSAQQTITTPATDPYVISVGALDDAGTGDRTDDSIAAFSSRGKTKYDGVAKPDVVAPGRKYVSLRAPGSTLDTLFPERAVTANGATTADYFMLSGTSMAAPVVAGTIALMLERDSTAGPKKIKKRLMKNATPLSGYSAVDQGKGLIDAYKAVGSLESVTKDDYNRSRVTDSFAKDMRKFIEGQGITWEDLTFNGGVDSKGITWENVTWENITWDGITWENITWEGFTWEGITWENITWEKITWESTDSLSFGALSGDEGGWDLVD